MAAETLKYLQARGARQVTVIEPQCARAVELARQCSGRALEWDHLLEAIAAADVVVSTTGAAQPIVTCQQFARIERLRYGRPLFILDLAVPRDFEPAIGSRPGVYLYAIDDFAAVCQRNRTERDKELPLAMQIIDKETNRFVAEMQHRAVGPIFQQLRAGWQKPKDLELERLFQRVPEFDEATRDQIRQSFDRLLGKLLHPPLQACGPSRDRVSPTACWLRWQRSFDSGIKPAFLANPERPFSHAQIGEPRASFVGLLEAGRRVASSAGRRACFGDVPASRQGRGLRGGTCTTSLGSSPCWACWR